MIQCGQCGARGSTGGQGSTEEEPLAQPGGGKGGFLEEVTPEEGFRE